MFYLIKRKKKMKSIINKSIVLGLILTVFSCTELQGGADRLAGT
jgi:hypothetical protein